MAAIRKRSVLVVAAGVVAAGILAAGGLVAFSLSHPAPAKLSIKDTGAAPSPTASLTPVATDASPCPLPAETVGAALWTIQTGSLAGYRAREKFGELEAPHEAVARTTDVSGFIVIQDPTGPWPSLVSGCVAVDVRTLVSIDKLPPPLPDATGRDQHYFEMFDASRTPYVLFRPSAAEIPKAVASGSTVSLRLTGTLTIRGTSRTVSTQAQAQLTGQVGQVAGSFVIHAPDFGVPIPGQPVVQPDVTIEFLLRLSPPKA